MDQKKINGVWTYTNSQGYVVITNGMQFKLLHRMIAEDYYGAIEKGYHVHHKDGDKTNNKPENLEVLSPREHYLRHARMRDSLGRFTKPTAPLNYNLTIPGGNQP